MFRVVDVVLAVSVIFVTLMGCFVTSPMEDLHGVRKAASLLEKRHLHLSGASVIVANEGRRLAALVGSRL